MAEQPGHHQQQHGSGLGGSQFGDTTLTKIFVGGLAWETQRDTMRAYFEQFGDILEAVVITDKNTGRSKGYGFVTFKDPESARRACENPTPVIDGRRANCNLAALGVRPRFPGFQGARVRHFPPIIGSAQIASSSSQPQQHQQQQQQQQVPFAYHQAAAAGFSYAPYGYTYVHEYPYPSLYNPYGNPQLSAAVYGGGGANSGGGSGGGGAGGGLTSPGSGAAGGSGGGALYTYSTPAFNPAAAAAATYPMSSPSYAVPQLLQYPPNAGLASPYVPPMVPLQHQASASSPQPQSQQQNIASPSSSSSQQASNAPAGLTVVPSTSTTTTSTVASAASTTMATTTTTTS